MYICFSISISTYTHTHTRTKSISLLGPPLSMGVFYYYYYTRPFCRGRNLANPLIVRSIRQNRKTFQLNKKGPARSASPSLGLFLFHLTRTHSYDNISSSSLQCLYSTRRPPLNTTRERQGSSSKRKKELKWEICPLERVRSKTKLRHAWNILHNAFELHRAARSCLGSAFFALEHWLIRGSDGVRRWCGALRFDRRRVTLFKI